MLNVGDIVQLNKDDACINWIKRAVVIHTPREVGDPFGFRNLDTGAEVYTLEKFTAYVEKRASPDERRKLGIELAAEQGYRFP